MNVIPSYNLAVLSHHGGYSPNTLARTTSGFTRYFGVIPGFYPFRSCLRTIKDII